MKRLAIFVAGAACALALVVNCGGGFEEALRDAGLVDGDGSPLADAIAGGGTVSASACNKASVFTMTAANGDVSVGRLTYAEFSVPGFDPTSAPRIVVTTCEWQCAGSQCNTASAACAASPTCEVSGDPYYYDYSEPGHCSSQVPVLLPGIVRVYCGNYSSINYADPGTPDVENGQGFTKAYLRIE